MKTLLSLILLMSMPAFADSQCDYVDPAKRATIVTAIQSQSEHAEDRVKTDHFLMFSFTNLKGAILVSIDLRNADFRHSNLSWTFMRGTDLRGAILTGADLTNADLEGAIIDSKYRDMIMKSGALNTDKINWVD